MIEDGELYYFKNGASIKYDTKRASYILESISQQMDQLNIRNIEPRFILMSKKDFYLIYAVRNERGAYYLETYPTKILGLDVILCEGTVRVVGDAIAETGFI